MHRWVILGTVAALISAALGGCAGGLIGILLGLVKLGDLVSDLSGLIGEDDDPAQVRVLLDGQLLPVHPDSAGNLTLAGLPEGRHLLAVVAPNRLTGAVRIINVQAGAAIDVGRLDPVIGGRITGTARIQGAGGVFFPAENVLVLAVSGGATLVDATHADPMTMPPATAYYAAHTDGNGKFSLDAVEPGDYLVTTAVAGYLADVQLVQGLVPGQVVRDIPLDLELDAALASGRVSGTVSGRLPGGTQSLPNAILMVLLDQGFVPTIPTAVSARIAQQSGAALMASPWFRWNKLSSLTDAGGSYRLRSVPGQQHLTCFAYGYQPEYKDIAVLQGQDTLTRFTLASL